MLYSQVSSCSATVLLACLADDFHFSASVRESVMDLNKSFCVRSQSSVFSSMSHEDAVRVSFVRKRADLGGDLCLEMGSGIRLGTRVGVEGLGSLLGLVRKSATDDLVFKDKNDMAEERSRVTVGSLPGASTGLGAARTFRLKSFKGRKGLDPPISSFGCLHMLCAVLEATDVDCSLGRCWIWGLFTFGWSRDISKAEMQLVHDCKAGLDDLSCKFVYTV